MRRLANLCARLVDVHPDGTATRVSFGVLNLAHRDGNAEPEADGARVRTHEIEPGARCLRLSFRARPPHPAVAVDLLLADDPAAAADPGSDDRHRLDRACLPKLGAA